MARKIAVLPGDGIGPEVMNSAIQVLEKALGDSWSQYSLAEAPVGGAAIDLTGSPLPDETLKLCEQSDAILFG